jgi:hypothetical protein
VWPFFVVLLPPIGNLDAGVEQVPEPTYPQARFSEPSVKALRIGDFASADWPFCRRMYVCDRSNIRDALWMIGECGLLAADHLVNAPSIHTLVSGALRVVPRSN